MTMGVDRNTSPITSQEIQLYKMSRALTKIECSRKRCSGRGRSVRSRAHIGIHAPSELERDAAPAPVELVVDVNHQCSGVMAPVLAYYQHVYYNYEKERQVPHYLSLASKPFLLMGG